MSLELIENAASEATILFKGTEADKRAFLITMDFVQEFPDKVSLKKKRCEPGTSDYYKELAKKFFQARYKTVWPKPPTTKPDQMVSYILQVCFEYSEAETNKIKIEHQLSMTVENLVGALLERYIGLILEEHGWVWCSGDFIKAVDFIKKNSDGVWVLLQVKNRNTTENSSSSAIRSGTQIKKWFRSFANKTSTNWEAFPDPEAKHLLSEEGFKLFVNDYLLKAKNLLVK